MVIAAAEAMRERDAALKRIASLEVVTSAQTPPKNTPHSGTETLFITVGPFRPDELTNDELRERAFRFVNELQRFDEDFLMKEGKTRDQEWQKFMTLPRNDDPAIAKALIDLNAVQASRIRQHEVGMALKPPLRAGGYHEQASLLSPL